MAGILGDSSSSDDDWFGQFFNYGNTGSINVPETQVESATAEPSFQTSDESWADYTGASTPETVDYELGGGETYTGGAATGEGDSLGAYIAKATSTLGGAFDALVKGAKTLFTTPETTKMVRDPATGKMVEQTTGGGLNDLSKMLLQGAITSIGAGQVAKWQEERKAKEAQKTRKHEGEMQAAKFAHENAQQAEKYRRTAFGTAPQLTATKGILGGG